MGARERVRAAIEAPTAEAAKLLNELQHADEGERLTILINGWCRGLAAALEELALSIDTLERRDSDSPPPTAERHPRGNARPEPSPAKDEEAPPSIDPGLTETELVQRAKESQAATAALRDKSPAGPRETDRESDRR